MAIAFAQFYLDFIPWTKLIVVSLILSWSWICIGFLKLAPEKMRFLNGFPAIALAVYLINWPVSQILLLIFPDIAINWALLVGSLIAFVIGILDDNWPLSPGSKLIGQILASAIVILFGRNLDFFDLEILNILK